jgi:NADPH-dependent curcumin reductase CurA
VATVNRQIIMTSRPAGWPGDSNFKLIESPVPEPGDGEFLVQALYLSVDPYMRGRMREGPSYAAAQEVDAVMGGGVVGRVLASNHAKYKEGTIVSGDMGWQEYSVQTGKGCREVDPSIAPISTSLGVLGMPGMTAYFGLIDICDPQAGETVFVSGAAGAVGSLVGQIAKIKGCRAVGAAGSDEKVAYITGECGFDTAFNYKSVEKYPAKLRELCPDGIDVYFDNVGGAITDAVFMNLNVRGRISVCGQISQYNLEKAEKAPRTLWHLIVKQARVEGFLVFQFADRWEEGVTQMAEWIRDGRISYRETVTEGIENTPHAFIGMMRGENTGKQLVKVAE